MKFNFVFLARCLALCALSLAGCSGGGGGTVVASAPVQVSQSTPAPAPVPPPVTVTMATNLQPPNSVGTYPLTSLDVNVGSQGLDHPPAGQSLTTIVIGTDPDGTFGRVNFNVTEPDGRAVVANVSLSQVDPKLPQLVSMLKPVYGPVTDDANGVVLTQSLGAQQLNSSAFGLWAYSYESDPKGNGAGQTFAFAYGNLTPPASVPTSGSATFNGTTTGLGGDGSGPNALSAVQGNVQINANFSSQSVASKFTNLATQNIYTNATGSLPDLTGTSSISGNAYSGAIAGTGLTGTINGHFYGTAARETAGVWQASGGGSNWVGSFGAK